MADDPQVSVVIPTRDRWRLLSRTLRSALVQEGVEHEVIVVDDGSTDETAARLAAEEDRRLRVVRHEQSRGVAAARNRGVADARGEWVAFLDDDDVWAPRKLRAQLDAAGERDASFAYAGAAHVDERGEIVQVERAPDPDRLLPLLLSYNAMPAGCSNLIVRTDLVRRLGGFDEQLFQLTDWDLWLRIAESERGAACDELLIGYLKHSENMLTLRRHDVLRELEYLAAKHRDAGRAHGVDFDRVAVARWIALSHRRAGRRREAARIYLRSALAHRNLRNVLIAAKVLLDPRAVADSRRPLAGPIPGLDWLKQQPLA